tara:strand:+ start:540 stop:1028 length:489 start_codon:yes stop_codon:yes gene_type:complete
MKYTTQDIVTQLIAHEGMELDVYQDSLGIDTIGVGRNLRDRGITDDELMSMGFDDIDHVYESGITYRDAELMLHNDIIIVEMELTNRYPILHDLGEVRQRVLVDMAFNMGVPRLGMFRKMWSAIYDRDYYRASEEMLDSKWASQVGARATELAEAMKTGVYD